VNCLFVCSLGCQYGPLGRVPSRTRMPPQGRAGHQCLHPSWGVWRCHKGSLRGPMHAPRTVQGANVHTSTHVRPLGGDGSHHGGSHWEPIRTSTETIAPLLIRPALYKGCICLRLPPFALILSQKLIPQLLAGILG
jgi:hypothetical protein